MLERHSRRAHHREKGHSLAASQKASITVMARASPGTVGTVMRRLAESPVSQRCATWPFEPSLASSRRRLSKCLPPRATIVTS